MRVQLNIMQNKTRTPARSVLAAALALPGLLPGTSQAQVTALAARVTAEALTESSRKSAAA